MSLERLVKITRAYADATLKANGLTKEDVDFHRYKTYLYDKGRHSEIVSLIFKKGTETKQYYVAKTNIKKLHDFYDAQEKTYEYYLKGKPTLVAKDKSKTTKVSKTVTSDTSKILLNLTSEIQSLKDTVSGLTNALNILLTELDADYTPTNGAYQRINAGELNGK